MGDTEELQIELINILSVQCADDEAALKWASKYSIPMDKLPLHLQEPNVQPRYHIFKKTIITSKLYKSQQFEMILRFDVVSWEKPTVEKEKVELYHTLKLPLENITWITSWEDLEQSISEISKVKGHY